MNSLGRETQHNNINNNKDIITKKFLDCIKLDQFHNLVLNQIKATNIIQKPLNTELIQFDMNISFPLDFTVNIKVTVLKADLYFDNVLQILKLRININNEDTKSEIISCTNYLQRRRNINLTLNILKKCATLVCERKLILEMLHLHSEVYITCKIYEESGILIECKDKRTNFKFFESIWKIQFDCCHHYVVDCIDFCVTLRDEVFHNSVKEAMNVLIKPNLPYVDKVHFWWQILHALKTAVTRDMSLNHFEGSRDFLRVRSIQEINLCDTEQCEIIDESDEENCIVID